MKLSKTTLIALCVGVFVVLGASLGFAYAGQSQKQSQLASDVATAEALLVKQTATFNQEGLPQKKTDLEARQAKAQTGLKDIRAKLLQMVQSIEVTGNLFALSYANSVNITTVTSAGTGKLKLAATDYDTMPLNVQIAGDRLDILDFIFNWTQTHPTGEVQSVTIATSFNGTVESSVATMSLLIYSLPEPEKQ